MQAAVKRDSTQRVITVEVTDVPDIDITSYHQKPRIFRPDTVTITISDGKVSRVNVSGGLVLKSGGTSESVRENQRWYGSELDGMRTAPGWIRTVMTDAPNGVTTWRTAETEAL